MIINTLGEESVRKPFPKREGDFILMDPNVRVFSFFNRRLNPFPKVLKINRVYQDQVPLPFGGGVRGGVLHYGCVFPHFPPYVDRFLRKDKKPFANLSDLCCFNVTNIFPQGTENQQITPVSGPPPFRGRG